MKDIKQIKKLWKFFVLFLLISFLIFNWDIINDLLAFFNYKVVWHYLSNSIDFLQERLSSVFLDRKEDEIENFEQNYQKNYLDIPKIKVSAPIVLGKEGLSDKELRKFLKDGVLLYPGGIPGAKGKSIILGHSAPPNWPDINYEDVFSNLNQLERGDEVLVVYNQKRYIYEVFDKRIFLPKDEDQTLLIEDKDESYLILITCWPPGKRIKRLAVLTKLIE